MPHNFECRVPNYVFVWPKSWKKNKNKVKGGDAHTHMYRMSVYPHTHTHTRPRKKVNKVARLRSLDPEGNLRKSPWYKIQEEKLDIKKWIFVFRGTDHIKKIHTAEAFKLLVFPSYKKYFYCYIYANNALTMFFLFAAFLRFWKSSFLKRRLKWK